MKVLHVISSLRRSGGGPARSAQGLVAGLNAAGVEAWLLSLKHGDEPWVEGVQRFVNGEPFENVAERIKPDIVHLHGLWNWNLHRCAVICRRWRTPYVIAPRGMLEPWSLRQKWLKKRIARWLYQDRDLKCAAALHATADSEAEQFRRLGFRNPVIVSPNGVNVPRNSSEFRVQSSELKGNDSRVEHVECKERRVLFVSRMHPKKGVIELVEAWSSLRKEVKDIGEGEEKWVCELVYTTNSDVEREYEANVKARILELGMSYQDTDGTIHSSPASSPSPTPDFILTGALDDEKKWDAYAKADLFVLPTYSENFGIVVAEALWAGLPVITTKGTPWSELEGDQSINPPTHQLTNSPTSKCGWWIDIGVDALVKALAEAIALTDEERHEMGMRGRKLVEKKYTWNAVVKEMIEGYNRSYLSSVLSMS